MVAPPPALASVRVAVRQCLASEFEYQRSGLVLVACSGGADSLALALAARFEAPRAGLECGLVTVDHGLQEGSAQRAEHLVAWAHGAGFAPAVAVAVDAAAHPGGSGPEATARTARYTALAETARETGADAVLLGHTLEDQAETVLLALARGSGLRGLAGMPQRRCHGGVPMLRPLLTVSRATARSAVAASGDIGIEPWDDPHNADPVFARARVRTAMPLLAETLGQGIVTNLARTAALAAADVELLDALAAQAATDAALPDGALCVTRLRELPEAIRSRVLHRWCVELGVTRAALSARHIAALDALVTRWRGQRAVCLPAGIRVARSGDRLCQWRRI